MDSFMNGFIRNVARNREVTTGSEGIRKKNQEFVSSLEKSKKEKNQRMINNFNESIKKHKNADISKLVRDVLKVMKEQEDLPTESEDFLRGFSEKSCYKGVGDNEEEDNK